MELNAATVTVMAALFSSVWEALLLLSCSCFQLHSSSLDLT